MRVLNVAAALLCSVPCLAQAQAFPSRQVTIIVPYQPGGNLGAALVAKSKPDGHTILMAQVGVLAIIADSPEHFAAYIAAESQKWRKVVTASGAKAD